MGWVKDTFNKAKSKVKSVATSKNLAIVAPYYSVFTKSGRSALKDTYGGAATSIVNGYTGGQGGAIFSGVLNKISPTSPPPRLTADPEAGGGSGGDSGGLFSGANADGSRSTPGWLYGAGVLIVGLLGLALYKRFK